MPASAHVAFGATDWLVVAGILALTTLVGALFGKGATIRDYFLGGRRLPWWSVSASIIATEISAVTLVSVPFLVFKPGGNFAYLQLVLIGSVLARLAIAWWLVPVYFEREIYSPYDFVGARLGKRAKSLCTGLFSIGGVLSQSSRVYLTALVLEIVLADPLAKLSAATHIPTLALSIGILTLFAVLWTWIGGMAAVVWTDFVLFFVFTASAIVLLFVIAGKLDLGFERIWRVGVDAHKIDFFDFDTHPVKAFTFWTAAIASSWGGIAAYGVDQLMAQRLFCCRGVADARKAIVWSSVGVIVPVLVAFVGVGLYAYYERRPMSESALALFQKKGENLLMIFTTDVVPSGWKGLVVAGILAAAISSLDGILTALSQTTLSSVFSPARRTVRNARVLVFGFGIGLGALAFAMDELSKSFGSILELALTMSTFTQGALLAGFALALLAPRIGGSGFMWSAPYSVLFVFALAWHGETPQQAERLRTICDVAALAFVLAWFWLRTIPDLRNGELVRRTAGQLVLVVIVAAALCWIQRYGLFAVEKNEHADPEWVLSTLAFPWYVPIASSLAFALGLLWARDEEPSNVLEYALIRMHRLLVHSCLLLAAFSCSVSTPRENVPVKRPRLSEHAMWVTRWDYKTREDCRTIAENCRSIGVDTILFQVRGNATAFYRSKLEPWAEQFGFKDPGFDPLATMIEEAHARGMRLVAWVNVVPAWWGPVPPADPNHVYNKHPEWLWYDQHGKRQALSEKFYVSLNPCLPEVRAHIVAVVDEIVSGYALDGLHLDYMRLPNEAPATPAGTDIDYPRDKKTLELFRAATKKTPEQDPAGWDRWRTGQVTELVRQISAKVHAVKPDIELSSAVAVKRESALGYHQDAYAWLQQDLVDAVYPMNYTGDPKLFATRSETWINAAPGERIVVGIMFDKGKPEVLRAQVETALAKSHGFSIFAYSSLFPSPNDAIDRPDPVSRAARDALSKAMQGWLRDVKTPPAPKR